MNIIRWSFNNLHVPMIETEAGKLFCTTNTIANSLGTTENAVKQIMRRNKDKLNKLTGTDSISKEFLRLHKTELGILRVKENTPLWSEAQMIRIALWTRTEVADQFVDEIIDFVRTHAKKSALTEETILEKYVTKEEHTKVSLELNKALVDLGRLSCRMDEFERLSNPDNKFRLKLVN